MENKQLDIEYQVIKEHINEFPTPITFKQGARLTVGEEYDGEEGWDNWFFCETEEQVSGWVPAQVFRLVNPKQGVALMDYTAQELSVVQGEHLLGHNQLNGWVWCSSKKSALQGWVPLRNLIQI
ncbi:hypothetical protein CWC29_020225 [Pseudoalteromonas sp. S4498]|uniref:SH3 domain-containing protein n=1 Tax=Pseudoalteromonas galatheae TaxID=579562 RepID=UPI00110836E8|nr:SH3 domain-containing protein [Pseudoalteromonas galatheae]NKC21113.1 hypothetical protein [Pseudoalteromonas galatheae]